MTIEARSTANNPSFTGYCVEFYFIAGPTVPPTLLAVTPMASPAYEAVLAAFEQKHEITHTVAGSA